MPILLKFLSLQGSNPRGSRSPTNQETANLTRPNPALNIVPEVSNTDNRIVEPEANIDAGVLPVEEEKIQNIPLVPNIKLTPADESASQNISVDATVSSFTDESMSNSVTEQSIDSIQSGETEETNDENDVSHAMSN